MALETVVEQLTDSTKSLLSAINTGVNTVGANLQDKITQAEGYAQQALTQKVAAQEAAAQATGSSTLVLEVYQDIQANWQTKLDAADSAAATATSAANTATTKAGEAAVSAQEVLAAQTDITTNWQDKLDAADAAATTATAQAGIATEQAGIATAAASGIDGYVASAEAAAAAALASQQSAASSVLTASTKAAQASESADAASLSSATATDQAAIATVKAATATAKADIATTKANEAAASAALAATLSSGGGFFNNVAAMQAANLTVGSIVRTSGYTTAGDGGGANYQIVSADTVIGYDEPNSQQFAWTLPNTLISSSWGKDGLAVVQNALVAPDGATTATFIRETNDNGVAALHRVRTQFYGSYNSPEAASITGPRVYAVYAAKYNPLNPNNSRRYFCLSLTMSTDGTVNVASKRAAVAVDLQTGTVTQELYGSSFTRTRATVTEVSGYWYIQVFVTPSLFGNGFFAFGPSDTPTPTWSTSQLYAYSASYAGDGASGVYVWKWGIRPVAEPGIVLSNGLQAKPLFGNVARLSQLGAASGSDNNALLKALSYFGANPGTLIVDTPTVFAQPSSLPVLTIPSNVDLKFEGSGALAGVTNMTVNSTLVAENKPVLPKYASVTFGPRQSSVKSNWFGL